MVGTYNSWLVVSSVLVAILVSYTALCLSARVARAEQKAVDWWLVVSALVMGTGIWSMHFIGMLAFSLPIPLSYDFTVTAGSLLIAVVITGLALSVTSSQKISFRDLSVAAFSMGLGVSAMHYVGMEAVEIRPMVTYEPSLMAASVVIAIVASFAALWLFFQLGGAGSASTMRGVRLGAAFVMGLAVSGMHYTAMAASRFSANSVCTGRASVDNRWLAIAIAAVSVSVLTFASVLLSRGPQRAQAGRSHH